jgi:hypothetical protein
MRSTSEKSLLHLIENGLVIKFGMARTSISCGYLDFWGSRSLNFRYDYEVVQNSRPKNPEGPSDYLWSILTAFLFNFLQALMLAQSAGLCIRL